MISLLDVNVLVALAWPNHVHHDAATKWFKANQRSGWATCPITQSGFVRVSANERIVPLARPVSEALGVLRRLTELAGHHFWIDDVQISRSPYVQQERLMSHRQIADAHLLAIALRHKGRMATFDRGIRHLDPSDPTVVVVVV